MTKKVINDNNGWIDKINILGKIAAMITKYGFIKIISSFLVFSMFAIMIIIFMNQKTIIAKVLEEQKQEIQATNAKNLQFRVKVINPNVDAILYELIAKTGCDRAFVIEMHNGIDNPSGMPFAYGDMTYEKINNDSIISVMSETKSITLSVFPIATYILKYKFFYGTSEETRRIDPKLANRMVEDNIKYIMLYAVRGSDVALGCVGISYVDEQPDDMRIARASLFDASQRLSILLDLNNNKIPK